MFIDYTDGPFWRAVTKYLDRGDRSALTEAVQRARGEIVGRDPEPVIVVPKKRSGRRVIKRVVKRAFRTCKRFFNKWINHALSRHARNHTRGCSVETI